MEITIAIVVFMVVSGFGAYLYLMIRHPEWVGITGDSARKTMDEHQEGVPVDDSDPFSSVEQKQDKKD